MKMYENEFGNVWKLNIIECHEMSVCTILIWNELWMENGSCLWDFALLFFWHGYCKVIGLLMNEMIIWTFEWCNECLNLVSVKCRMNWKWNCNLVWNYSWNLVWMKWICGYRNGYGF